MVKLILFVSVTIAVVLLENIVSADDELEPSEVNEEGEEGEERSGAFAKATAIANGRGGIAPSNGFPANGGNFNFPPGQPSAMRPNQRPFGLVECYSCMDCPEILPNTTSKFCPRSIDPTKKSGCVVYAEKFKHLKKTWLVRGCVSERGSCADIAQAHSQQQEIVKLLSCSDCEGDKCNGSSRSVVDFSMAILSLFITPLVAKLIVS